MLKDYKWWFFEFVVYESVYADAIIFLDKSVNFTAYFELNNNSNGIADKYVSYNSVYLNPFDGSFNFSLSIY